MPQIHRAADAPAILGGFDPGRVRSDSALNVRNRTQLLAALSTYRDSDGFGLDSDEGGGYASESESKNPSKFYFVKSRD